MKRYSFLIIAILIFGACNNAPKEKGAQDTKGAAVIQQIPNRAVAKSELDYNNKNSSWSYEGKLFSGYALSKFDNDSLSQKFGILNGKKENECTDWYPNGKIKSITNYHDGKLDGQKRIWDEGEGHRLIADLQYKNGRADGEQKKWYPTGEVFQVLNMKNGREEGAQKAYRKNGVLYANYEAKNGRIFGMKKAALCFGLEDQKIKNEE